MFALEALRAKHGDCLLLHWGTPQTPRIALIDGGPDTTYSRALRPRLRELAEQRGVESVKIDLTMVSHIDDDHINGILDLCEDIERGDASAEIGLLWHNSLEGLLDQPITKTTTASVTASIAKSFPSINDEWGQKILASVPQGQELHAFAKRSGIADLMNSPFGDLVVATDEDNVADIYDLRLTVISPHVRELEALREKWVELRDETILADYKDRSPYNLSSIVVMAEFDGMRMLLTGDARGDHILAGLDEQGFLSEGSIHVDLLKLPHHGSRNNVTEEFFTKVTADTYVASGDHVKFPNPHEDAMRWLKEARRNEDYRVICTYELQYLRDIFGANLVVPSETAISIAAELKR